MTTSLITDIIKEKSIYFRGITLGDHISGLENKEGPYTEKKLYSNPFVNYFIEIGEMEELSIYYNFEETDELVKWITLNFIHYPDHYWKKEGHSNTNEFLRLFNENKLQPFSLVFIDTVNDAVKHFTDVFGKEPETDVTDDGVFKETYHNFRIYKWAKENELRLSITTYIDDSDERNIKNTMKIWLRKF